MSSMTGAGGAGPAVDFGYQPAQVDDHGVGGTGEELAQTLEKVVS